MIAHLVIQYRVEGTQMNTNHFDTTCICMMTPVQHHYISETNKHLKKSNAACFYTPIVLKLSIIVQMW